MITIWMFCFASPAARRIGRGVFAQQLLDLGVAQHRRAVLLRRAAQPGDREATAVSGAVTETPVELCAKRVTSSVRATVRDAPVAQSSARFWPDWPGAQHSGCFGGFLSTRPGYSTLA